MCKLDASNDRERSNKIEILLAINNLQFSIFTTCSYQHAEKIQPLLISLIQTVSAIVQYHCVFVCLLLCYYSFLLYSRASYILSVQLSVLTFNCKTICCFHNYK